MEKPDSVHLDLIRDVSFRPVFIIGLHRSGTTLLYNMLAESGHFNVVTTYHVLAYDSILDDHVSRRSAQALQDVEQRLEKAGARSRAYDGARVRPDLPEEYGFAIALNDRPQLLPNNLARFLELCKKVQYTSDRNRWMLLKNPWDMSNFAYIKRSLPQSRFIFIHRHPLWVLNSQIRGLRSALEKRNSYMALIAPWYERLFREPQLLESAKSMLSPRAVEKSLGQPIEVALQYFLRNIDLVPATDICSVRYEDLCASPDSWITRLLDFLELPPEPNRSYAHLVERRNPPLLPEASATFQNMCRRLEPYLQRYGYGE
ncbi:MAG TPA: sulfotransferase [Candidatus Acidoferrales bacterium]|nr:sulfotransferase [Candidatus Acidoferrales bacterium]